MKGIQSRRPSISDPKQSKPPLRARTSSKFLEVGGSVTPSKSSRSRILGKSPSFVSVAKSDGEGTHSSATVQPVYVEKYNRKYPDKELPFTDKDRAAAMAMGTKDIKVSLQVKKKREKKQDEPGEREFQIRFALVEKEIRNSNPNRALQFVNKAMEFRPNGRECYVARSRCNLMLGQIRPALADAETALTIDKEYIKAVFAKAEALYALGDFEHALVYYHRGHRLRPELEEFRLGIQKGQDAILQVIGENMDVDAKNLETKLESRRVRKPSRSPISSSRGRSPQNKGPKVPQQFDSRNDNGSLGDLNVDVDFMQRLINSPELTDMKPISQQRIKAHVEEALDFLRTRQEFWAQRRPRTSHQANNLMKSKLVDLRCATAPLCGT